jgi:hypothetical protein
MHANLDNLVNAYRLAHRASENPAYDNATRAVFRATAYQIWLSLGKAAREEVKK